MRIIRRNLKRRCEVDRPSDIFEMTRSIDGPDMVALWAGFSPFEGTNKYYFFLLYIKKNTEAKKSPIQELLSVLGTATSSQ